MVQRQKESKKFTSAEEVLGSGNKSSVGKDSPIPPTSEEFNEVFTPDLSSDTFVIADKTFRIKISNIKTQKIMAKSLNVISELIGKIDVDGLIQKFQKIIYGKTSDNKKNGIEEEAETEDFVNMINFVQELINQTGIGDIAITIMDLYVGVIYAICHAQDSSVTRDWIEDNINFAFIQDIFFRQMQKDQIQGKVIDFLSVLTRTLTGSGSVTPII
jgi:hypothetical protein